MAKKKNIIRTLVTERYLIWAIVFSLVVAMGLIGEIERAKAQMDADISSTFYIATIRHK